MIHDVVLLAADKAIETGVTKILARAESLGCKPFTVRSFVHVGRDPGCYRRSPEFLSGLVEQYRHALVMFDQEGSGTADGREEIEADVEARLGASGWGNRAACIVIDPEIENWLWTDSPHVASCLGWHRDINLRQWLADRDLWPYGIVKPPRPKEAVEAVLRVTGEPRSSALYGQLAQRVSLSRCTDPAFLKLRRVLTEWFSIAQRT